MKKFFFKALVKLNNTILPKYSGRDPSTLTKREQLIIGFRYWALINSH